MRAVNLQGTGALVAAAAGRIGRWVQLSSAGVYGRYRDGVVSEKTPVTPQGEDETSKAQADQLVIEAAANAESTRSRCCGRPSSSVRACPTGRSPR